ncbi:MAG: outer membrane lipoprotein LolB [Gammaproteobacteria bacterium]|nr:outer membrane lipoprotein LolB [Gammaproteobacteria bacterium]
MMKALLSMALLLLAACTTTPSIKHSPEQLEELWQAHQQQLKRISNWEIDGRAAVRANNDGGQISLSWQQQADHYTIELSAPFGQGVVKLKGARDGVAASFPDEEEVYATDVAALLHERLGWRVPVNGLQYWVLGLPAPDAAAQRKLDGSGRLARLQQSQWRVDFKRYTTVDGLSLPKKITLNRDGLRIKLIIDQWHVARRADETALPATPPAS